MTEDWTVDWQQGDFRQDPRYEEFKAWILNRPEKLDFLMMKFPPMCLVRANRPLRVPAPGTVGFVQGYSEPFGEHLNGLVLVIQGPDVDTFRAQCDVNWLEIVGFWKGLDRDAITAILNERDRRRGNEVRAAEI